jgi:hypothetical protein
MSHANVTIVRSAFAEVTIPGDPEAMIAASSPDFEMHLIGITGETVHYAGASGIRDWFRDVAQSGLPFGLRRQTFVTWAIVSWCWVTYTLAGVQAEPRSTTSGGGSSS